jgi:prenylcysteine oxidase/farnesylcysteine lyase
METETISSRNIVDLLLHEHFASGVCGPWPTRDQSAAEAKAEPDFVLGWDC